MATGLAPKARVATEVCILELEGTDRKSKLKGSEGGWGACVYSPERDLADSFEILDRAICPRNCALTIAISLKNLYQK